MKKIHLSVGNDVGLITCIGAGVLTTLLISVALTMGLTSLIQNERLSENGETGVFLIRVIATLVGGLLGAWLSGKKMLLVIGVISGGYLMFILGLGVVVFDGSFDKLWLGVLSVVVGAVIALLIKLKHQSPRKRTTRYRK